MQNLIVSLNKNKLRVSSVGKEGLSYISTELDKSIVTDNSIKDIEQFSTSLKELIPQVTQTAFKKLALDFLVPPEAVILMYLTVSKGNGDVEEQIINEVKERLEGVSIDDLYFAYEKIAPFVYQFTGIRKDSLEKYLEISNAVGIQLRSVIPWVLLLPKYAETNDPAIFIVNYDGDQVVALSELNGVFFSGVYSEERKAKELQALVEELSIYKRPQPITKIYTLNYQELLMDKDYEVVTLDVPNDELLDEKGFEINLLANYVLDTKPDRFTGALNLLNLLPVPVIENKKNKALVVVGAAAGVVIIAGVLLFGRDGLKKFDGSTLAKNTDENTAVMGENSNGNTVEEPEEISEELAEQPTDVVPEELDKAELVIMVENGAGIAGIASRTKTRLEDAGYTVFDIGNSDADEQEETLLRFKKNSAKYASVLQEDLKDVYLEFIVEEELDEGEEFDLLLVVGTNVDE